MDRVSVEDLRKLPREELESYISSLSDDEREALLYDWMFWARESQLPPEEPWHIWLLLSGRGYGKTRIGAEMVRKWAFEGHSPIALVARTTADARDIMVEVGESSISKISPPWFMPKYEPSKRRLTWPNGVEAVIYYGDDPDQLRGHNSAKAWVDELAKFQYPEKTWEQLMLGVRIGKNPQTVVTTTPRPINILKKIAQDANRGEGVVVTRGHTLDNKANLAPEYLTFIMDKYEGTRLGRQELAGEILDSLEGLVYDQFDSLACVVERFAIPSDWPRYVGHDFGPQNTAAVWYAQDPSTGFFYVYRTYLGGKSPTDRVEDWQASSRGERIVRRVGGNYNETDSRDLYTREGWHITEPRIRRVLPQVEAVNQLHKNNQVYAFSDMHEYLDEKLTFSWEVDKEDQVVPKIHNESQYHLMACERYLLSDLRPVRAATSNKIPILSWG